MAARAETKKREARLAELEDKISDLTELCAQLEKEKLTEQQKNISAQRIIEQVDLLIVWCVCVIGFC